MRKMSGPRNAEAIERAVRAVVEPLERRVLLSADPIGSSILVTDTTANLDSTGRGFDFPGEMLPLGSTPRSVTAADVDGDGAVDLITAHNFSNSISVLRNLGDGSFAAQVTYAVGSNPYSVTAADVDGDGAVDLITANSSSA